MVGIASYGAYVPIYRLSREVLSQQWGTPVGRGEKAVANINEDSLTMAAEAVIDCLGDMDRGSIDGLYFASTTPPYREKECASIIRAAADLRPDVFTADFTDSLSSGAKALRAAVDAVKAGSAKKVIVVASDCRLPAPNSEFEPLFGDGAAAFLVSDADVAVDIEGAYSMSSEFMDTWRKEDDIHPLTTEDRFIREMGYERIFPPAVSTLMKNYGKRPEDFNKVVLYGAAVREHTAMVRRLKLSPEQVQDPMFDRLGNTGAAFAPMMLVAALEKAKAGDSILWTNYSDGFDGYILRVNEQIEKIGPRRGIERHLTSKMMLPNYGKYLRFRNLMQWEPERRFERHPSLIHTMRESKRIFNFYGQKCKRCGAIQYPEQHVCIYCQAIEEFEDVRLSDKKGHLFTFSMDERAMEIELPKVLSVVDLEGGGRVYSAMTDRDPSKVEIGMPVEFTFRKVYDASNIHNYFWRVRPVRC